VANLDATISTSRTTRGAKVKTLTEHIKRPGLEFVQVDDLIDSDLTEPLKGKLSLLSVFSWFGH
jgi:hypothetical protein